MKLMLRMTCRTKAWNGEVRMIAFLEDLSISPDIERQISAIIAEVTTKKSRNPLHQTEPLLYIFTTRVRFMLDTAFVD